MYDCLLDKQLFYLLLKLKGILVNSDGIKTGYVSHQGYSKYITGQLWFHKVLL